VNLVVKLQLAADARENYQEYTPLSIAQELEFGRRFFHFCPLVCT
jgi:hypothetical protein